MSATRLGRRAIGATLYAAAVLAACGGKGPVAPEPPHCPDMTLDALDHFDFAAEMKIQPPVSSKLRPAIEAALLVDKLADGLDAELRQACTLYLADLGAKAAPGSTAAACTALVTTLGQLRAQLGPTSILQADFTEPLCAASLDAANVCETQCDPTVGAGTARATCEPGTLRGACDGLCSGSCDLAAPGHCAGTCSGTCDARVKGTCGGACTGKCDGKLTAKKGSVCAGICEGACSGPSTAVCTGTCTGSCILPSAASCAGTCNGSCTTEMKGPSCTGDVSAPKTTPECKAKCDALVTGSLDCSPRPVFVRVTSTSDPTAEAFTAAAEKDLPAITRVAMGWSERIPGLMTEVKRTADDVQASVKAALIAPDSAGQVTACFGKPFSDVSLAAASLQANVDLAVSVKAALATGGPGSPATLTQPLPATPPAH